MVSFDVQSLFTSLPVEDCVKIVSRKLLDYSMQEEYTELLKHCFTSGYQFVESYLWNFFNSMPVSLVVGDIFMEAFEETALNTFDPSFLQARAQGICDEQHLAGELQHVKQVLRDNKLQVPRLRHRDRMKPATVERVPAVLPYMRGVTDKIDYILKRASIKTYFKPPKKISQFLPQA